MLNTDVGGDVGGFGEPLRIKQWRNVYYCSAASNSAGRLFWVELQIKKKNKKKPLPPDE